MNKEHAIELISTKIKLIRTEKDIHKIKWLKFSAYQKTLVQIEKGERMQVGPTLLLFVHCLEIVKFYRILLGMIH